MPHSMLFAFETILKLVLACLLGGIVGWERELHDRPAGFRTHVLVSMGSAVYMMVSLFFGHGEQGRVAANVATGMGFLGAGTIIRHGSIVRGLTTAASLWTVAAIGLAAGYGAQGYLVAIFATLLALVTLTVLSRMEKVMGAKRLYRFVLITASDARTRLPALRDAIKALGVDVRSVEIAPTGETGLQEVRMELRIPPGGSQDRVTDAILGTEGVRGIHWEQ